MHLLGIRITMPVEGTSDAPSQEAKPMEIIISTQEPRLDGPVDSRFGRAQYFLKVNCETKTWEAFPNPAKGKSGGAGVVAAQFAVDQQAHAIISGDFGPNAARVLRVAGVRMLRFSDSITTAYDALDQYLQGKLEILE
jgi:predicted Fe-Mo cluster-binding NifX family protein